MTDSQLLDVAFCLQTPALSQYAEATLREFRFRRSRLVAKEIEHAAKWLGNGGWITTENELNSLKKDTTADKERKVARYLQEHFKGLGPKQSRNLIQWMGLSQYEVPLDSRMVRVLKTLAFPVPLSSSALAGEGYYCFIEDGLQIIMAKISVLPCIFDACAFASGERNAQPAVPADGSILTGRARG